MVEASLLQGLIGLDIHSSSEDPFLYLEFRNIEFRTHSFRGKEVFSIFNAIKKNLKGRVLLLLPFVITANLNHFLTPCVLIKPGLPLVTQLGIHFLTLNSSAAMFTS